MEVTGDSTIQGKYVGSESCADPHSGGSLETYRTALVHEWLSARAGSEILFERLAGVFPDADLYALTRNPIEPFDFAGRTVQTTALDRIGWMRERRSLTLPVMPLAWRALNRPSYDIVVSSSHAFAREFSRGREELHLNYVHAPMRYAWSPDLDPRIGAAGGVGFLARAALRRADIRSVKHVDSFAANSSSVADRIQRCYGRQARVIPPPVDTAFFEQAEPSDEGYLLSASRFIEYKRHDLAISVAAKLDLPLIVAGSGPEEKRLRALAAEIHPTGVTFEIQPQRQRLRNLMAGASAFLFCAHEDFGIIVPEVLATGTPVVALAAGGSLDTVADGRSGVLAQDQTPEEFVSATRVCLDLQISSQACRRQASRFAGELFDHRIRAWVRSVAA